ncbi:MAG: lactate utilization protein [Desulfobacterium sp.]|nr:lactate utilization protein [Desulfobacterium sp.]
MKNPVAHFHALRLEELKTALEANNFEVWIADTTIHAKEIVINEIIPRSNPQTISWGGSMTLMDTGIEEALNTLDGPIVINKNEPGISKAEKAERIKAAMTAELYFTGTNAVTENGQLVNLDMIGNRVGALTFGPREVVVLMGQNKVVPDLDSAMVRIKEYAAPTNAMRLDMKTPCTKTGQCMDCSSPARICNTWTITEKSFPPKRVKVILIRQDLGL